MAEAGWAIGAAAWWALALGVFGVCVGSFVAALATL